MLPLSKLASLLGGQVIQLRQTVVTPSGDVVREEIFEAAIRRGQTPAEFLKVA